MTTVYEKLKTDLKATLKLDAEKSDKEALKVIVGEFQRQPTSDISDEEALKILRKLKKNELMALEVQQMTTSKFVQVLNKYIPKDATEADVRSFISENIDLPKFPNRATIIGIVMKEFKGRVDGNLVKKIVSDLS